MLWVLKRTVSMIRFVEHPKHILELRNKEIFTILHSKFCLSKPMILLKRLDVINYTTHIEMVSFNLMSISTSIYISAIT